MNKLLFIKFVLYESLSIRNKKDIKRVFNLLKQLLKYKGL